VALTSGGRTGKGQVKKFFYSPRLVSHVVAGARSRLASMPAPCPRPHHLPPIGGQKGALGKIPATPTPGLLGPQHHKTQEQMVCHPQQLSGVDRSQIPSKPPLAQLRLKMKVSRALAGPLNGESS
jgi:hypothetical protein